MAANAPIHVYLIDDLPLRLHTAHYNKQSVSTQSHSQAPVFSNWPGNETSLNLFKQYRFHNSSGGIGTMVKVIFHFPNFTEEL